MFGITSFTTFSTIKSYTNKFKGKVAVHISGVNRGDRPINSIMKYIVEPLNADVFCDSQIPMDVAKVNINSVFRPKKAITNNILPMLYRMYKLQGAFDDYCRSYNVEYDVVIRIRPDMVLRQYLPDRYLIDAKGGSVLTIPRHQSISMIISIFMNMQSMDILFFSSPDNMRVINNVYLSMKDKITDIVMGEYIITEVSRPFNIKFMPEYDYVLENYMMDKMSMSNFLWSKLKAHLIGW